MSDTTVTLRQTLESIAAEWGFDPENFVVRVLKLARRKADHAVAGTKALSADEARDLDVETPAVEVTLRRRAAFVLFVGTYVNDAGKNGRQVCLTTRERHADLQPILRSTDSGSFYLDDFGPPEEDEDFRASLFD